LSGLTDAERARLEQKRDRIMKLLKEGDASGELDPDERKDLSEEWNRIDAALQGRRP
jgi:hypothetical protein